MKKGFTLVELLVTVGIMGMLSTVAVSGYFAAARGMADRGALTDVRSLIRVAQQRATADHMPTAVVFYNIKLRDGGDDSPDLIQGKAVALRMAGRFSRVASDYLFDEFADLEMSYPTNSVSGSTTTMRIYKFDAGGGIKAGKVDSWVTYTSTGATEDLPEIGATVEDMQYAFHEAGGDASWKTGDAYAFEIASTTLPNGYFFGSSAPTQLGKEVQGESDLVFMPGDDSTPQARIISAMTSGGKVRTVGKTSEAESDSNSN